VSGLNERQWSYWVGSELAILTLLTIVGFIVLAYFCIGLVMTWRAQWIAKRKEQRGFEVKISPSMTPGLLEKKEDHHG
jgi:hypothetical protein